MTSSFSSSPEFIAVILAATNGSRMFPLTTDNNTSNDDNDDIEDNNEDQNLEEMDDGSTKASNDKIYRKHLLPVGGIPIIQHLINTLENDGFEECHVILHPSDINDTKSSINAETKLNISYYILSEEECNNCNGSADALRYLIPSLLPKYSNVVVLPADLMLFTNNNDINKNNNILGSLCDLHRKNENGCTILLENSGDEGEDGLPLKESTKLKKGGYAREEEDIEYIAYNTKTKQIIYKKSKIDIEEDHKEEGTTPKIQLPLNRLFFNMKANKIDITMDINDLHVYILSPWMLYILNYVRLNISNLQMEFIPLLISRQFRTTTTTNENEQKMISSIQYVFGNETYWKNNYYDKQLYNNDNKKNIIDDFLNNKQYYNRNNDNNKNNNNFGVYGYIIPRRTNNKQVLAVRCCTMSSYLYANRDYLLQMLQQQQLQTLRSSYYYIDTKYQSIIPYNNNQTKQDLPHKITCKRCVLGKNITIGARCKLNNVVIYDNVSIGDNCTLQNSIIGYNVRIGDNVSLNDVQVCHDVSVANGTKLKNESIV